MEALWRSKCPACGEWIEEGDEITRQEGEWVHDDCADDDDYDWSEWQ